MAKRFVICIDSGNNEQNDAFLHYIKSKNAAWWHWIKNVWLIVDTNNELKASDIRDELNKTHPYVNSFVLELEGKGDTWSGYGPNGEEKNMFNWLENTWSKYK